MYIFAVLIFSIAFIVAVAMLVYFLARSLRAKRAARGSIHREAENPIIRPSADAWRNQGTFNPTAIEDSKGRVHMLYRAIGQDGISRVGYASSADGVHFDDAVPYPVFAMEDPKADSDEGAEKKFDPVMYPSGGSWGGVEDPRLVSIDGTIYMTFNAFDGWDYVRVGVASIKEDDFFNKRFKWSKPEFISPKGEVQKNWVLFPEKINGKFAILHSITPTVLIEFVDRLEEITKGKRVIKSRVGPPQGGRKNFWDTRVRGAGPPPVKTKRGWLVLYHAIDKKDPGKYKLGGMLLDLKNPKKIVARSPGPFLEPNMWYENDWKPGVVYACGAIVRKGELFVYYGGGDKYVCVAHAPLEPLLDWMTKK